MKELLRHTIAKLFGIVIFFFVINTALLIAGLAIISTHTKDSEEDLGYIRTQLSQSDNGTVTLSFDGSNYLQNRDIWMMLIDPSGNIICSSNLPQELNHQYSIAEVAQFSRWYLSDYPVLEEIIDNNVLVLGYTPDDMCSLTLTKLYYVTDTGFIYAVISTVVLIILCNIISLFILFRHNSKSVAEHVESEFRKKDNARAEWINGITHDIRTPLSIILGNASQMEKSLNPIVSEQKQARQIRQQCEKARELIIDLNLVSKFEYSSNPITKKPLELLELIRSVLIEYMENCDDSYSIIPILPEVGSYNIEGDEMLLKRMLSNLINNAIYHNKDAVEITVEASLKDSSFYLKISDNGIGMPLDIITKLNNNDTPPSSDIYASNGDSAHGVGLRLVKDTVFAHGGSIRFNSSPEGGFEALICFNSGSVS